MKRRRARTWNLKNLIYENPELWTRCRSLHRGEDHFTVEAGFSLGFSITEGHRHLVATCLRCGATFTEMDELKHDLLPMFDVERLAAAR